MIRDRARRRRRRPAVAIRRRSGFPVGLIGSVFKAGRRCSSSRSPRAVHACAPARARGGRRHGPRRRQPAARRARLRRGEADRPATDARSALDRRGARAGRAEPARSARRPVRHAPRSPPGRRSRPGRCPRSARPPRRSRSGRLARARALGERDEERRREHVAGAEVVARSCDALAPSDTRGSRRRAACSVGGRCRRR